MYIISDSFKYICYVWEIEQGGKLNWVEKMLYVVNVIWVFFLSFFKNTVSEKIDLNSICFLFFFIFCFGLFWLFCCWSLWKQFVNDILFCKSHHVSILRQHHLHNLHYRNMIPFTSVYDLFVICVFYYHFIIIIINIIIYYYPY